MNFVVSIVQPFEGLRYVQVKAPDGYRAISPINEDVRGGVQAAEKVCRSLLEKRQA